MIKHCLPTFVTIDGAKGSRDPDKKKGRSSDRGFHSVYDRDWLCEQRLSWPAGSQDVSAQRVEGE